MAALQALAALQPRHCFGVGGRSLHDGLAFLEEGVVAYPAGAGLVVHSIESRTQRFIAGGADSLGVTAFAACPGKRVLALAERGAEKATLTIVDLQTMKRRKVLTSSDTSCKEFVSVCFSSDGKYVAAQGGAPDWTISLWIWEKSKLVASARTVGHPGASVTQCLVHPGDEASLLSAVGEGTFRLFRIEAGNTLKQLPSALTKRESQAYTAHAWLVDNDAGEKGKEMLVAGTAGGELLVAAEGELRQALQLEGGVGVASLAAFSKGFVVGTTTGGLVVFERDSETKPYRQLRSFNIEPVALPPSGLTTATAFGRVRSLAVAPTDDTVAALTDDNQLLLLALGGGGASGKSALGGMGPLAPGCHAGEVTGLATCARRPLVATCGVDRTIRLWNWHERRLELAKAYDEEVHSLALHPSGHALLAGFADRLRLLTVLSDDLAVQKELPIKGCREVSFSNGGAYFAAAAANAVHVYATYTGASVAVLRGHNGRVRSLWWSADDTVLVTAGVDGAVYEWRVLDGRRVRDFVQKGWAYTAAAGMHGGPGGLPPPACGAGAATTASGGWPSAVFVASADKKLRLLEEGPGGGGLTVSREIDAGAVVTAMIAPGGAGGRLLLAGGDDGSVRSYRLPLQVGEGSDGSSGGDCQAVRAGPPGSTGGVTRLAASADEALLFAATAEGCVIVYDIKDRDPGRLGRKEEAAAWAEEVLVGRGDIDERRARMAELEAQVAEVTAQNEYQLKLRDLALGEKVAELTAAAAAEATAAKARYDSLLADRAALEAAYESRLRGMEEAHAAALDALDGQYQQKLIAELERYQDLQQEKEMGNAKWEAATAALAEQHAKAIAEVRAGYEARLATADAAAEAASAERAAAEREWAELRRQLEDDVDREVVGVKDRSTKALNAEREANLRLQGENGILRRRHEEQARLVEASRAALRAAEAEKASLQATIDGLRAEVAGLLRDVAGRDETISEKERRILELKLRAQELEKLRFVLSYKLGELRAALDPKDAELADVRSLAAGLEAQLAALARTKEDGERAAASASQREAALHKEAARARAAAAAAQRRLETLQRDVGALSGLIQKPVELKAAAVKLFQTHAAQGAEAGAAPALAEQADDGAAEARAIEGLEATVRSLRGQLEQAQRSAAATQRRLVGENSQLIATITELKREIKALQDARRGGSRLGGDASVLVSADGSGGSIKAGRSPARVTPVPMATQSAGQQ